MQKRLALGWKIGVPSGWGVYGVNLAVQLARQGVEPVLLSVARPPTLTPEQAELLKEPYAASAGWLTAAQDPARSPLPFPVLHALGDQLDFTSGQVRGTPDIGVVFFESATIPAANLKTAERFALIVTGSGWNAEVLRRHGYDRVANCPQGVDLSLFAPAPRQGRFVGRFAIFSGGKLEYRKGQDLVVVAFKRFHARHPDALLVTAWHNPWPAHAKGLGMSPHVNSAPGVDASGALDVAGWLRANGLPESAFLDLGPLSNAATPALLREVDLAVFPSRCEGGTNLVAMECMACGVPVVLSRNTGHLDLIRYENCYTLDLQIPMGEVTKRAELDGWGESSIEELVNKMTQAYDDPGGAKVRGAAGAAFMQAWDWSQQVDRLLQALAPYL